MKNAVIVHGKPTKERYQDSAIPQPHQANWLPWLQRQLTDRGIETTVPAFPRPYYPEYDAWCEVFEQQQIKPDTGLIGHSTGADFILHWLSLNPGVEVERVALVAPWHDKPKKYGDFSTYQLDVELTKRVGDLVILSSTDDDPRIRQRATVLTAVIPGARHLALEGFGHFMLGNSMSSEALPELLQELTGP